MKIHVSQLYTMDKVANQLIIKNYLEKKNKIRKDLSKVSQTYFRNQFKVVNCCSKYTNDMWRNYLFILLLILSVINANCGTINKILTNSTNYHLREINVLKINSDYSKVYSVDFNGIMKIWNFNYAFLELKQQININGSIQWQMSESLFIWSNGAKLFIGSTNNLVSIYTLNPSNSLYIQPPIATPSLNNIVISIWVNLAADNIFAGTLVGCHRLVLNGTSWIVNTPSYVTSFGSGQFNLIKFVHNEQKLIVYDRGQFKIKILHQNGSTYSPYQVIQVQATMRNCYISSNQLYICCYGLDTEGLSQFHCYKLDVSTNFYFSVRQSNVLTTFLSQFAYMNENQQFIVASSTNFKVYRYRFQNSSGNYSYSFLNEYSFNGQRPLRIAYQRGNSRFQLVSTWQGNIYLLTFACNNTLLSNCVICHDYFTCNECKTNYVVSLGKCVCPYYYQQISGICDNFTSRGIVNCLNAQKLINGTIVCHFCSIVLNQMIYNNQCVCQLGYHDPNNTGLCTEICGDGVALQYTCDDSNIISGDGCSASCQIQSGFGCDIVNGTTLCKSQSLLRYSQQVQILKDQNNNRATIKLTNINLKNLLPFPVQKIGFIPQNRYISLFVIPNLNQEIQITDLTLSFIDSEYALYIEFDFYFTIQNLKARIELNYQNTRYYNYTQKIDFVMEGANMALKYSENLNTFRNLALINLLITIFSIIILFFGFFTPKFIGLEMILTCQLIFFSQFLIQDASKWHVGFIFLKNLKISTGYNEIMHYSQVLPSNDQSMKFYNLSIKKHVIQNLNLSFMIVFLSFIVASIFLLRRFFDQRRIAIQKQNYKKQKNSKQKQQILENIQQSYRKIQKLYFLNEKSYSAASQLSIWLILSFFSAIGGFLLINDEHVKFEQKFLDQKIIRKIGKFTLILSFSIIMLICLNYFINFWIPSKNWIQLERRKQEILYKRSLFIYLLVLGYLIFFFNNVNLFNIPISVFVLLFQISFILVLYLIDPYRQSLKIHTFTLFINHFVYAIFLVVINMINLQENLDQIVILCLGYFISIFCTLIMVMSIIRLYYQYRYGQKLQMQIQKQRQQQQEKMRIEQKIMLQRKKNSLEEQAINNLSQTQRLRYKNKYLQQNQKLEEQQLQLLKWLKKRNWSQQQKQKYYFNHFHQKPLSWLRDNDKDKYIAKLNKWNEERNQSIQKNIKKQNKQEYKNLLTSLSSQHSKKMDRLMNKIQFHKNSFLQDPQYNMNITKNDKHKFITQSYQIKE